jgi:hypothetical protein
VLDCIYSGETGVGSLGGVRGVRRAAGQTNHPDTPRVVCALKLLTEELNATPATIPGDRRPLTYRLAEAQISTVS